MPSVAIAVLLTVTSAAAQAVLDDPVKIAHAEQRLDTFQGERLNCAVTSMKPRFNFSLRLQAGYVYRVPLNQYRGAGHAWIVLTRITPQEGNQLPVYLADVDPLPPVPNTDMEAEVAGTWWVGEGRYRVKSLLFDDSGRGCLKEWRIEARLSAAGRKVKPRIAPHTVVGLTWRGSPPSEHANSGALSRLTILLDAAAMFPMRTLLTASDRTLLLDALSALVEELPARSVKLVVFHLGLQKEVFRRDGFTTDAMPEVVQAIAELQPSLVDYSVLQNQGGALELIANLANLEIRAPAPSDAVIFLGPRARYTGKIPAGALDQPSGRAPRFFYLQCVPRPNGRGPGPGLTTGAPLARLGMGGVLGVDSIIPPMPNGFSDSIGDAVARLKGKIMFAGSPEEFAQAIAEVERSVGTRK
jgi:hypothetical protein